MKKEELSGRNQSVEEVREKLYNIEEIKDDDLNDEDDDWFGVSSSALDKILENKSRSSNESSKENEKRLFYELQSFHNAAFYVKKIEKALDFNSYLELQLAPPMDQFGTPQLQGFIECPIVFKLYAKGKWSHFIWAEKNDLIRVIGTFSSENNFTLTLDDNTEEQTIFKASMLILEPYILIPCTQIVNAFPCPRNAFLNHQFKGLGGDVNYALVLGNVIHSAFQSILQKMDFTFATLEQIVQNSTKEQLVLLYYLGKTEEEVHNDVKRAVRNITEWLRMVFRCSDNPYGIRYVKFIAAEQEFNTPTYGIKGNMDSTIVIEDQNGKQKSTALEIKTGKHKSLKYRGQVMLYSLLISERFLNSNPENILLYIMDENLKQGFEYLKQCKSELDSIIIARNQLAKYYKKNNVNPQAPSYSDLNDDQYSQELEKLDSMQLLQYPPMISQPSQCKNCFTNKICSIAALSVEENIPRKQGAGQFPVFEDFKQKLTPEMKSYFKKFIECISLEQNAENDRNSQIMKYQHNKERNLKITNIQANDQNGTIVTLEKQIKNNEYNELQEQQFVNLYTIKNITFSKGFILKREIDFKPILQQFEENENSNQVKQELNLDDIQEKMKNIEKYFDQYVIYTIEFSNLMDKNISELALGQRDPYQLDWTIEIEPFSTYSFSIMKGNIQALCQEDQFVNARNNLIYLKPPTNPDQDEILDLKQRYASPLKTLNEDQKDAVIKSILAKNYHIVLGAPGSGKTTSIVALVKILASMKKKVILVNYTNQAVDNVLIKLKRSGFNQFIRIASNLSSVDELIRENVKINSNFQSISEIRDTLESNYIFGATCLQVSNNILLSLKFDYCIMDEASQINEPLAVGPILMSDRFVMFGDHYQLNPLVKSWFAERKGLGVSLFERLYKAHPKLASLLTKQYRMNSDILQLMNEIVYQEAAMTFQIVQHLIQCGIESKQISVITPFLDQQILLKHHLNQFDLNQVLTIDKCQGMDSDIVILSCVKTQNQETKAFKELKRLNVALTRAKKMLVIIGSLKALQEIQVFQQVIQIANQRNWILELKDIDEELKSKFPKQAQKYIRFKDN